MFRAPLCPSSGARECYTEGCCLWYLVFWFSSCRYGVELRVMCPVCGLLLYSARVSVTIMPIIRSSRVLYRWLLPVVFGALVFDCRYGVELRVMCPICGLLLYSARIPDITLSNTPYRHLKTKNPITTGSNLLYDTVELLMMGIMVLETCWASNKTCNKNHLLHLVGILLLHKKEK